MLFESYRDAAFPPGRSPRLDAALREGGLTLALVFFAFFGPLWLGDLVWSGYLAVQKTERRYLGFLGLALSGLILLAGLTRAALWKLAH